MSPELLCKCWLQNDDDAPWQDHSSWCPIARKGKDKAGPQPTPIHQAPPPPGSSMHDPHLLVDVRRYTDSLGNTPALTFNRNSQVKPTNSGSRTYTVWAVIYEDKWGTWRIGARAWHSGDKAYEHLGRLVAEGKAKLGRVESTQVTIDQEVQ